MIGGLRIQQLPKTERNGNPLVSIITVVLNGEQHLEQTILSVLNQTYNNIQYIIIDGGSTDRSIDIIKTYESKIDYWKSEKDNGIYDAMNKGLAMATGSIIGIINSDDYYLLDSIETIVECDKKANVDIYYGNMEISGAESLTLKPNIENMYKMPSIFHPTCFIKKTVYDNIGSFNSTYKISGDYDFLLRCLKKQMIFYYVPKTLTVFRPGGLSSSCYSNIEGYKIMKEHQTGFHKQVIRRAIICYLKTYIKKIIHLGRNK